MSQSEVNNSQLYEDVTLSSTSSTRPTLREVWRPVQTSEVTKPSTRSQKIKSFRRKLLLLNIFGMTYYVFLGSLVILVDLFVTLPFLYSRHEQTLRLHQVGICFIYTNMMLNYILIVFYAGNLCSGQKKSLLPQYGPSSCARYCDVCQDKIPARGKHCVLCDTCVLKRDHHCYFAGCCIGFYNQRYFIVFCFYAAVGSFINVWTNLEYLSITYADPFNGELYKYVLPWCVLKWMFSTVDGVSVSILTLAYFTTMTGLGCAFFLIQQIFLVYRGQTSYEFSKGVRMYQTFPADHFRSVFGYFWLSNFIIPMPWFRNFGDGRRWNILKHV